MSRVGMVAVGDADQTETTNVVSPVATAFSLDTFALQPFGVRRPLTGTYLLSASFFSWRVSSAGTQFWLSKPHCFSHLANSWFSLGRDATFPCHLSVATETAYEASLNRKNSHLPARSLGAAVVFLNDRDWISPGGRMYTFP
jgi:hypothetical protein